MPAKTSPRVDDGAQALGSESARFVATEWDAGAGILFARGVGDERADEVVFAAAVAPAGAALHATADRAATAGVK